MEEKIKVKVVSPKELEQQLCKADNENQDLYDKGIISRRVWNIRRAVIHTHWVKITNEQQELERLKAKYGRSN